MQDLSIVWFRQDLRVEDNPALSAAVKRGRVIPLFIWSPYEEGDWPQGAASRWWLHHSLESLVEQLQEYGLTLLIRKGSSLETLKSIIRETEATAVFWNRRYEPQAMTRDAKILTELQKIGISSESFNAHLLFEPWTIQNKQNKPFQIFSSFWEQCLSHGSPEKPLLPPRKIASYPKAIKSIPLKDLQLLPKVHWDLGIQKMWTPGSRSAQKRLCAFLETEINSYHINRDRLDLKGVSYLSPYLHFGEISPRTVWHGVAQNLFVRGEQKTEGSASFLRQLGWREFAHYLLYHFPSMSEEPLRKAFTTFPWRYDHTSLKAWQKGHTGYPIVDAGMRELWTTGWMHNRSRMIVGSFLVKDLLLPWQDGTRWFWDTLVDADLATNSFGWQWISGCGADAAPYFRIFNPVTQGKKFDPNGDYVRRWIPEIGQLPTKWIHNPWKAPRDVLAKANIVLGETYPYPIVDHYESRKRALECFKTITAAQL